MRSASQLRPKGLFVGLATVDLIYTVDEIPRRDQKISVPDQQVSAGGPATNAAVTFAFLGGRPELVTAVSVHPLTAIIRKDLRGQSVRLHDLAARRQGAPPVSSIMVRRSTGERTVVSANAAVFSRAIGTFSPQWLRGASILLVDGHYMPLAIAAASVARKQGVRVVMDSGSWKDGMAELLPLVGVAICSDDYRPPGCRNRGDVFEFLRARNIAQIAITRGPEPIQFFDGQKRGTVAVEKIKSRDTLGAGDIFHGAFCFYACRSGTSFRDALAAAARVASFSCRFPGTREWMQKASDQGLGIRG